MRYMLLLKGDPGNPNDADAGGAAPDNELVAAMIRYHEELSGAGVLVSAEGLLPSSADAARVVYKRGRRKVVDGPFAEAKELVAGYYVIDVGSLAEAVEWASKCPVEYACTGDMEAVVEIRRIATLEEVEGVSAENVAAWDELKEKLVE